MPRTELGPAACKRGEWDYSGHVPVSRRDSLDARFKNSLRKPPRKGNLFVGPSRGIQRSNLEPGQSVFDLDKPRFDLNRFKTGQRLDYIDQRIDDAGDAILTQQITALNTSTGAAVPAVCEGASCGEYAKNNAKNGSTSHESLSRKSQIPINVVAATVAHDVPEIDINFGRLFAAAIIMESKIRLKPKDKNFVYLFRPFTIEHPNGIERIHHPLLVRHNGRLLKHIERGWFGDNYPKRWDQAASCYLDVRIGQGDQQHRPNMAAGSGPDN